MAYVITKNRFHVALDGNGLILQGAPGQDQIIQDQAAIYGQRFASGDRGYTDFSFWWYWAQADWSGGIKSETLWDDDAMYHSSKGITTTERPGALLLNWRQLNTHGYASNVTWNDYVVAGLNFLLVGRDETNQKMLVMAISDGSTYYLAAATGATQNILCAETMDGTHPYFGCRSVGSEASFLKTVPVSTVVDAPGAAFTSGAGIYSIVGHPDANSLYLFTDTAGIYKYDIAAATYTSKIATYPYGLASKTGFSFANLQGKGAWLIGDQIFFLYSGLPELWCYDIGLNAYSRIYRWGGGFNPTKFVAKNNALYIMSTNTNNGRVQIYKYAATSGVMSFLAEIGRAGDTTSLIAQPVADSDYVYFAIDDGTSSYQIWCIDNDDHIFSGITPPASYATTIDMLAISVQGNLAVVKKGASGTNKVDDFDVLPKNDRQTTGFCKTSIFDGNIPSLDKLFQSISLSFDPMLSGQSITIEYSLDGGANFTSLGSASFSVDGGSVTSKILYFGSAIVSKTLMLKKTLASSGGANTPVLTSFSVQYSPFVDYAKTWKFTVNCAESLRTLDGQLIETTGRELHSRLEKSWLTKSLVDFQDLDFASTTLNDAAFTATTSTITCLSTADFPESGRVRIENEEIIYTGKTPTTLTGLTRGARGTQAVAHANSVTVSNGYRVIITEMNSRVPIALEGKRLEYTATLSIREA